MTQTTDFLLHTVHTGDDTAPHRAVFLHGLFGRGRNFASIAKALQPETQSLLVDLPNHGRSSWTEQFDYIEIADIVARHLRADFASGGPVDIIGHSMGGKVAMVLALRHPDLVRRLVVLDVSPVGAESSRGEFEHLLGVLSSLDLASVKQRSDADQALEEQIPSRTVRGFLLQNLKAQDGGYTWEANLTLLYTQLSKIMGFPEITDAHFDHPVLWVRGSRSNYVTEAEFPAMAALFPTYELVTIQDAGHWVHSEKPQEVVAALRGFLLDETTP